jgi:glycosyltransferase involved in cell wall biosynthesis
VTGAIRNLDTKVIRILCVIETLGRGGGAEQLVFSLAPELRKLNVEVEFVDLFSWPDDLGHDLEFMGFRVHRLNITHRWSLLEGLVKLRRIVKGGRFDILWGHLYFGNLYVQLAQLLPKDIKSIITLHSEGYYSQPPTSVFAKIKTYIEGFLNSRADMRVGVSNAVADDYQAYFGWNDVQVVYNGVSTLKIPTQINFDQRRAIRLSFGFSADDFLIVVPARLVNKKGHIYLLQALEILNADEKSLSKAIFAGVKGGAYTNIKSFISEHQLGGVVSIREPLAHPELFNLILAADVVVLPSLREPFGIGAAEAMTTGVPVVLTKVDGFIELVGNSGCVLMVQPGSPKELADAIRRLINDPGFAAELGARGRGRILDNFDISVCAAAWRDKFLSVANQ